MPKFANALSVGVITDIHAGGKKTRKSGTSVVYPKKAVQYFERAVQEMQKKDVDLIVSLGDTTQSGEKKYYNQLKKVAGKYRTKVLWIKGNHDSKYFSILSPSTYFYDKDQVRFIILNTGLCTKSQMNAGCLDQSQVDFLNLNKTENTVILQHVPPLIPDKCEFNIKYVAEDDMRVLAGHWHSEMTCGNVMVFPALTEHKRLTYRIININ